jgi:hypothetical protein
MLRPGLLPTPKDPRDYSAAKTFGEVAPLDLPDSYALSPLSVKDQDGTDFCTAYAACALAEAQDSTELSPEWFFSRYGQPGKYGASLRQAAKAAVKDGFLPKKEAPYSVSEKERDFLANEFNWPPALALLAAPYKKKKYFRVDYRFSPFDAAKQALWQYRGQNCAILTGCSWREEWQQASGGYIPRSYGSYGVLHAFAIVGFKSNRDGASEDYLIVQNSYGAQIGDGGLFYFPKEVVNREFTEPMYMFVDLPNDPKPIGNPVEVLWFKLLKLFQQWRQEMS